MTLVLDPYPTAKRGAARFYAVHDRTDPTLFARIRSWSESQSPGARINQEQFGRDETLVSGNGIEVRQSVRALVIDFDAIEEATVFKMFWSDSRPRSPTASAPTSRTKD